MLLWHPVRRFPVQLLVAGLIWAITPGLAEVAENAWHLVVAGHQAHALDRGADHAPAGDEHGCSGTFHLCSCHHTLLFDLTAVPLRRPNSLAICLAELLERCPSDAAGSPPEHPPRS